MAKVPVYIRIDEDTLHWFRQQAPRGYQTRINDALRIFKERRQKDTLFLLGRAQEIFRQYHSRCFWHLRKDMQVTEEMLPLVREGLKKYGGREGFLLAAELTVKADKK